MSIFVKFETPVYSLNTKLYTPICTSSYQVSILLFLTHTLCCHVWNKLSDWTLTRHSLETCSIVINPPASMCTTTHKHTHKSIYTYGRVYYHACRRSGHTFPSFWRPLAGVAGRVLGLLVRMSLSHCFPSSCALLSLWPPLHERLYF